MKINPICFLLLLLLVIPSLAISDTGQSNLQHHLQSYQQLQGRFTQIVEGDLTSQSSTGEFWIKKPNQFRWHYSTPYVQKIISNGKKVWIYDEDLEQVSIKSAAMAIESSPLSIILGSTSIEQHFKVERLTKDDSLEWLKLTPTSDSSGFEFIHVGFKKGILHRMKLQDNFGQTTRLLFTEVSTDTPMDDELFQFQTPEGSDIFDETIEQ